MIQSIENIALTGVNAQNISVDVTDGSVMAYRVSIDTSSQITGNKTIAFTGVASESLTVINFIIEGGINTSGASKLIIGGVTIPDLFALKKSIVFFEYVNSAWVVHYSISAEQPGIIDGDSILDGTIPADKLENDIAGSGMTRDGNGGVVPNLEASQPSLQIVADELGVKIDPSRAVTKDSNGVGVNLESSDPSLQISANELGVKVSPDKGLEVDATGLGVKVDPAGDIEIGSTGLYLKNGPCACLKELKIEVSSTEILSLNSSPKELIPAQGTGTIIDVVSCAVRYVSDGSQYATNTNLVIFTSGLGFFLQCDCLGSSFTLVYKFYENPNPGVLNPQLRTNWPINLSVENGDPTGGTSTIEIFILYRVMDINA